MLLPIVSTASFIMNTMTKKKEMNSDYARQETTDDEVVWSLCVNVFLFHHSNQL